MKNTRQNKSNQEPRGTTKDIASQQGAYERTSTRSSYLKHERWRATATTSEQRIHGVGTHVGTIKKYQLAHQHGGEDAEALHGREGR